MGSSPQIPAFNHSWFVAFWVTCILVLKGWGRGGDGFPESGTSGSYVYWQRQSVFINREMVPTQGPCILLVLFIVIRVVGNLHVYRGPNGFNGERHVCVRLHCTGGATVSARP